MKPLSVIPALLWLVLVIGIGSASALRHRAGKPCQCHGICPMAAHCGMSRCALEHRHYREAVTLLAKGVR